jgi:uncharacterized protein YndB with AHSA1/START domain
MHIEAKPDVAMAGDALRERSGRDWPEWYALLDGAGGPGAGRRALTDLLMKEHGLEAWWATTVAVEYERARAVNEKDGRPKGYAICVTKTIAAAPERVFDAFGDTGALATWMGAGARAEFKEGGAFSTADGNRGSYGKITRPKKLRFTWENDDPALTSTVEVLLSPKGEKCALVLNHERIQTRALADGLRAAWGSAIDRLKTQLEAK